MKRKSMILRCLLSCVVILTALTFSGCGEGDTVEIELPLAVGKQNYGEVDTSYETIEVDDFEPEMTVDVR